MPNPIARILATVSTFLVASVLLGSTGATAEASLALLRVRSVADSSTSQVRFVVQNASDLNAQEMALSLTLENDDGVFIQSQINLKTLLANTSTEIVLFVPGATETTKITNIEVDKVRLKTPAGKRTKATIKVEFDAPSAAALVER